MCASIIVSCWGKIQERRQRELDYKMRVSSHPSLDAIDRVNLVIGTPGAPTKQMPSASAMGVMGAGVAGAHLAGMRASKLQQQQQQSHQLLLLNSRNNSEEMEDQMGMGEDEEGPEGEEEMMMMMMEDDMEDEEEEEEEEEDDDDDGRGMMMEGDEEEDDEATATCYVSDLGVRTGSALMRMEEGAYSARLAQQHSLESNQSADLISPSDSCPLFYQHATTRGSSGTCNPLLYTQPHLGPHHHYASGSAAAAVAHHHQLHPLQMTQTDSSVHSGASNGSESPIPPPPPPPQLSHLRNCPAARTGTPLGGSSHTLIQPLMAGNDVSLLTGSAAALSLDVSKLPHTGSIVHLHGASSHPHLHHAVTSQTSQGNPSAVQTAGPQSAGMLSRHLSQRQLQSMQNSMMSNHCTHAPPLHQAMGGSLASASLDSEQPVSEPAMTSVKQRHGAPDVLLLR